MTCQVSGVGCRRQARQALCWLTAFGIAGAALGVSVEFDVQPRVLRVGETAVCSFTVRGAKDPAPPELPPIAGFQVRPAGTERSFSFGTGGSDSSITFRYAMVPIQTGKFTIGPFAYAAGNQTVNIPAVALEVVAPDAQPSPGAAAGQPAELLFARLSSSTAEVYNQQVFDLRLAIYTRGLNIGNNIGLMNMPATGLTIQPFEELPATREEVNGQLYDVRRFRAKAQALTAGTFKLQPVLRVPVQQPRQRRRSPDPWGFPDTSFFDDFFGGARTQPVDITPDPVEIVVRPLPSEGRPPDFAGAVGRFSFDVQAKPDALSAGDPVTVTLTVSGEGNIENVPSPAIKASEGFKTYDVKLVSKQIDSAHFAGTKKFEQVVIPRSADVSELPALTFSFFDPASRSYHSIARGPFALKVSPSSNAAARLLQASPEPSTRTLLLGTDIVYLKPAPVHWRRIGDRPWYRGPLFLSLQLLPPIALAVLFLAVRRRETLARDVALARRHRAPRSARAALARAEQALRSGDRKAYFEAFWDALASYFGNRLNLPPGAVTSDIVLSALQKAGISQTSIDELHALFTLCEQARFGSGSQGSVVAPEEKPRLLESLSRLNLSLKSCERIRL